MPLTQLLRVFTHHRNYFSWLKAIHLQHRISEWAGQRLWQMIGRIIMWICLSFWGGSPSQMALCLFSGNFFVLLFLRKVAASSFLDIYVAFCSLVSYISSSNSHLKPHLRSSIRYRALHLKDMRTTGQVTRSSLSALTWKLLQASTSLCEVYHWCKHFSSWISL